MQTSTPEGTANIVVAHESTTDASGRLWVKVRLPGLPGQTSGWVPRGALGGYTTVRTLLLVDLSRLTARLLRDGREIFRAQVGVGQPAGRHRQVQFYVRDRLHALSQQERVYGPIAFGTERSLARADGLARREASSASTGRTGPELLPGRVSHGCIRMRNEDIVVLDRLMPVGTPLRIVA